MTPKRILVTGANGFVGHHLLPVLSSRFPNAAIAPAKFDVGDRAAILDAIRLNRPDVCVHLAAVTAIPTARRDPSRAWAVNLHGTLAVAEALWAEARDCLLIFASSADAYGASFRSGQAVTEEASLAPLNTYGATKAAADLALGAMAADGLRVVRVRAFNHTGAGQSVAFVIPAFASQLARIATGKQVPVMHVGDLSSMRDFMDVRDVCLGYAACIERAEVLAPGTIINLASGTPRRVGDVLDELMRAAGVSPEIRTDPGRLRTTDIPVAYGDATKARSVLGWAATTPWIDTLTMVMQDWRARVYQL